LITKELRESKFDRFKTGYIDESGDYGLIKKHTEIRGGIIKPIW